ncbi:hypothetical protein C1X64_27035 [Pseudomonas sp. GW456-E7]|nr:hypothetical protein C1X64_27035 [Pseudomonas sp. GW456-E7]
MHAISPRGCTVTRDDECGWFLSIYTIKNGERLFPLLWLSASGQKEFSQLRPGNQGRFSDRVKLWYWQSDIANACGRGAASVCYDLRPDAKPGGYDEEIDLHTDALIIKRGGKANFARADAGLTAGVPIFVTKQ